MSLVLEFVDRDGVATRMLERGFLGSKWEFVRTHISGSGDLASTLKGGSSWSLEVGGYLGV